MAVPRTSGRVHATSVYGTRTAPAVKTAFTADAVPGRSRWHQGFKSIDTGDDWIIPFLTEATAARIAAKAQAATKIPMIVVAHQDFYGYRPKRKDET